VLDQVAEAAERLKGLLTAPNGALRSELRKALQEAGAGAAAEAQAGLLAYVRAQHDVTGSYLEEISAETLRREFRRVLSQRMTGSALAAKVQPVLRARFAPLRDQARAGVDMVMAQINLVLKEAIKGAVTAASSEFTA